MIRSRLRLRGGSAGGGIPFTPASLASKKLWWSADEPTNTVETVSSTFAPSAVNTSNGKITLPITGFTRVSNSQFGIFYFSNSGGSLPSPLVTNKGYVGVNNGDGTFSFYPVNTSADYASFPDYDNGETIVPGMSYACDRNKIIFTTQGTGTHTVSTMPLVQTIVDKVSNTTLFNTSERANRFQLLTDVKGAYIYQDGAIGWGGTFIEPEGKLQSSSKSAAEIGALFENLRYLYSVAYISPLADPYFSKGRAILYPSNLVIGTGVFSNTNHGMATGTKIKLSVMSDGGSLPVPTIAFGADIYLRAITANTFGLYPTATDAVNDTNRYVYSSAGSGIFVVSGGTGIKSSSSSRRVIYDINMQSNDHTFSHTVSDSRTAIDLSSSSYFMPGGFGNGNLNFIATPTGNWTILESYLYIPSDSVGPICTDTGTALVSGQYWITKEPGQAWVRFHRSLANAQASVGVLVNSLANTQVIKYGTLGSGQGSLIILDKATMKNFDDGFVTTGATSPLTYGENGSYALLVDYNDGSGKWKFSTGKNSVNGFYNSLASSRNSPMPAKSVNSLLIHNNAGQPHIPGHFKTREVFIGGSNTDPTADINAVIAYFNSKYGL